MSRMSISSPIKDFIFLLLKCTDKLLSKLEWSCTRVHVYLNLFLKYHAEFVADDISFFIRENKSWYFMWIVYLTDNSHEMSRFFFSEIKKYFKMWPAAVVTGALRIKITIMFFWLFSSQGIKVKQFSRKLDKIPFTQWWIQDSLIGEISVEVCFDHTTIFTLIVRTDRSKQTV